MSLSVSKTKLLRMEKHRQKKLASSFEFLKLMNKLPTLSERLKAVGIKENKPTSAGKRNNTGKRSKKRKNFYKKLYLEKPINGNFKNSITKKKLRNLQKDYFSHYTKESAPNEGKNLGSPLKNEGAREKPEENVQPKKKETVFVPLDFIQDCQNYKRNVRKHDDPMNLQKKTKNLLRKCKPKKEVSERARSVPNPESGDCQEPSNLGKESIAKTSEGKETSEKTQEKPKFDTIPENSNEYDYETIYGLEYPFETNFMCKPVLANRKSENVARIDKKFLESLLSIATSMKSGDKTREEKESKKTEKNSEKQNKKFKTVGKTPLEGKVQNADTETQSLETPVESTPAAGEKGNEESVVSYKELISAKLTRDTAKSEVQIQPLKSNGGEGSKMKSEKNMTLSKRDNDDTRRKRKTRNKIMKNGTDEVVEASFPGEVSKVADVKELWRRETRHKSENSLSSYSSCTVPEGDEVPDWKTLGLHSYKILKKLVEEEVTKITQKSAKKDNAGEVEDKENISQTGKSRDGGKPRNYFNKLKPPLEENSENARKVQDTKVNDVNGQAVSMPLRKKQHYSVYEGKRQKSQLSNFFSEKTAKGPKEKVQILDESLKKGVNIPSAIINKWSILNRLEQAFLVLGTPNFNIKPKKPSNALEYKTPKGDKKTPEKVQESSNKKPRSKEVVVKKKNKELTRVVGNLIPKNQNKTPVKSAPQTLQNKKIKIETKVTPLKDKRPGSKPNKETKSDNPASNTSNTPKEEENKVKLKEKKTPKQTPPDGSHLKNPAVNSLEKLKINSKREKVCVTPPTPPQEGNVNKFGKLASKLLKSNQNQEKKLEGNLERKKTFNVIRTKDRSIIQPRKSKSCNKTEENSDLNGVKLCFSQTKTQENLNGKAELCRMENEAAKRTLKKTVKTFSTKEKPPQDNEKPKSGGEKDLSKGNREDSLKSTKNRLNQEKKCEESYPTEDLPQQLSGKELNTNSKKRAVKGRSILSMRVSQHEIQEQIKQLPNVEEKPESVFPVANAENTAESREDTDIDSGLLQQKLVDNYSNISCISTSTFDLTDTTEQTKTTENSLRMVVSEIKDEDPLGEALSTASMSTHVFGSRQSVVLGVEKTEINPLKKHQLWEKDMNYYHAIVREIMSHYKRIDGFLKQTDYSDTFSSSLLNIPSQHVETDEELKIVPSDLQSLEEYRKKVMYEYQVLPFCEYKSQLQQKSEELRKRNLQVVTEMETEMDVKDFQINVHKVLDSQLYVDGDLLVKRNETDSKFKEKKSSLQDIVLCKNEKPANIHEA